MIVSHAKPVLLLTLLLFASWVVFSGKFDALHLGAGVVGAATIAVSTRRLLRLPPAVGASADHIFQGVRWGQVALYVPWLAWEIVASSVHVAYVVLQPRLPVSPRLLRFEAGLPHTLARLVLANSITITPGTVTLDVDGDDFVVHALTDVTARSVEVGRMRERVGRLFEPGPAAPRGGEGR